MKVLVFLPLFFLACSQVSDVKLNRTGGVYRPSNYKVEKKSSREIPKWIAKPQVFGKKKDKQNRYFFFSFITEPKISKEIACNLIKAYGRDQIGDQIVQVLAPSIKGSQKMETYLNEELLLFFQEGLKGAQIVQTYWEKRKYYETNEEGDPIRAYICAMVVKVPRKEILRLIGKGKHLLVESFPQEVDITKKVQDWEKDYQNYHLSNF